MVKVQVVFLFYTLIINLFDLDKVLQCLPAQLSPPPLHPPWIPEPQTKVVVVSKLVSVANINDPEL